jgi:hypothetical protein
LLQRDLAGCQIDLQKTTVFIHVGIERHVRLEQHVVLFEVRLRYLRITNKIAGDIAFFHEFLDGCRVDGPPLLQEMLNGALDGRLALPGRQIENGQVFPAGPGRSADTQFVIGHAKTYARKEIVPPTVVLEGTRLTNQTVDYMPVIDLVFFFAMQAWEPLGTSLGIPDFQMLGKNTDSDFLANKPTGYTVGIVFHANRARTANSHLDRVEKGQRFGWKGAEGLAFLPETLVATGVFLAKNFVEESLVVLAAGEIPAAQK